MKKLILIVFGCLCITYVQAQSINITEINYRSANKPNPGDWIELHNYGATAVNIGGYTIVDSGLTSNAFTIPPNTTIQAGGYLVFVKDQPNFTSIHPTVSNYVGEFTFALSKDGEIITLRNTANAIVAQAEYLTTNSWPKGANGEGRTLDLINQAGVNTLNNPIAWRDGCMLGSPGSAPVPCNDPILISEINYNSDTLLNQGEFVEILNNSTSPINLTGWYIRDGKDTVTNKFFFLQNTIINPGAFIVISNDTASLHKFHGVLPNEKGNFTFNLNNGGEIIRLFDPFDVLKFSVHYNDSIPFTDSADGKGYTLELKSKTGYMNEGSNWFAGCRGGSPGAAYTANCRLIAPLGIYNLIQNKNFSYYIQGKTVHISNTNNEKFTTNIYNIMGQKTATATLATNATLALPTNASGIYMVECIGNNSLGKFKIFIQ